MKYACHAPAVLVMLALAGCGGGPGNAPSIVATEVLNSPPAPIVATETPSSPPTSAPVVAIQTYSPPPTPQPGFTASPPVAITPAEAYSKYQQGAFFVDVRSQPEYDRFHIERSVLIPLQDLPTRLNEVPANKDVVVVCYGGVISRTGAGILLQAGFTRVSYVRGGLDAWMQAGNPIYKAP